LQTRRGYAGSGARTLSPNSTHVAPHSSKAPGLIKLMPLPPKRNSPVNPRQEPVPVRTSGSPAHTPGALSPSVPPGISRERTVRVSGPLAADFAGPGGIGL
jgi:hypothetical protein